MNSLASQAKK
jgi:hypothetical protein